MVYPVFALLLHIVNLAAERPIVSAEQNVSSSSFDFRKINLPAGHLPYYLHNNQDVAASCSQDPRCPFREHLTQVDFCWGYETTCRKERRFSSPICDEVDSGWAKNLEGAQEVFWRQADFGYVMERLAEAQVLCRPRKQGDSLLSCCSHLQHCRASNLYLDLRNPRRSQDRFKEDFIQEGEIGGHCDLDSQKLLSQGDRKSPLQSWHMELTSGAMKTPTECCKLLQVAKLSFLASLSKVQRADIDAAADMEIVYYLESLLVLKHMQRPGAIQNMTVSEWEKRIFHDEHGLRMAVVGVKAHKTATQQVATFALNPVEASWFSDYLSFVRPRRVVPTAPPIEAFFLSSTGCKIHSVSADVRRYHYRYGLQPVLSQEVRKSIETWINSRLNDPDKHLVARYLAHSDPTAERVYREKTIPDICRAYRLISSVGLQEDPLELLKPDEPGPTSSVQQHPRILRPCNDTCFRSPDKLKLRPCKKRGNSF